MSTASHSGPTGREGIYLDHAATSPLRPEVWDAMQRARATCFNPASSHAFGRRAHECLEAARERLAGCLGCRRKEVYFTGGGTQSYNLAILGFVRAHIDREPRVLVSAVEHKAGLQAARRAAFEGAETHVLPVDCTATVALGALEDALREGGERPTLVSVMWANNEVGTVQPVAEAAELAHRFGAAFHTDAVQAFGKLPVSVGEVPADLLTITAHKLGGPVGIGALYRRDADRGVELEPITYGGSQERSLWPGTQNPLGAVGFAEAACRAVEERDERSATWRELRDRLAGRLRERIPEARVHAEEAPRRLPNLLSLGVPGCDPGAILVFLDMEGVAVSAGSACSSGAVEASHVLGAMGLVGDDAYATLRFSLGHDTTREDVDRAAAAAVRACARVREAVA